MNGSSDEDEAIEIAAWRFLDEQMDEAEAAGFTRQVAAEPEVAERYVGIAMFHQRIRDLVVRRRQVRLADPEAVTCPNEVERPWQSERVAGQPAAPVQPRTSLARSPVLAAMLATAATLAVVWFAGWVTGPRDADPSASVDERQLNLDRRGVRQGAGRFPGDGPVIAATLTGAVDCEWEPGFETEYGEFLVNGSQIRLRSGIIQLTFESGAKIIVQGPADFAADSGMLAEMVTGKIAALCPQTARGFRLRTPSAEIIDIGTEFAVDVHDSGDSEVHVLKGEVVTRALSQDGRGEGKPVSITANNAMRFVKGAVAGSEPIGFNGDKFVRRIQPLLAPSELPPLPVSRDLCLWLSADVLVRVDESDRVLAWRDVLVGDNQSAEDATSVFADTRPKLVKEGMNGKPTIRFHGRDYLVTTPITTTDDQTIFVVYSPLPQSERVNRAFQLISYNGPPVREPVRGNQAAVLQLGNLISHANRAANLRYTLDAYVYEVRERRAARSGETHSRALEPNKPTLVSYCYSFSDEVAKMAINGRIESTSVVNRPAGITSRKVIGRHGRTKHFLHGDISEVLIYNAALSADELRAVEDYLIAKYELDG